jgi:hypothetical protein
LSSFFKTLTVIVLTFIFSSCAFALNEWYEGYNLEPYWAKSKSPLILQYDDVHILDLQKNIVVGRGEASIYGYGLKNRQTIENKAIENAKDALIESAGKIRLSTDKRLSNFFSSDPSAAEKISKWIRNTANVVHCRIFTMRGVLRATSSIKLSGSNSLFSTIYPLLVDAEKAAATLETASVTENEQTDEEKSENEVSSPESASESFDYEAKGTYTGLIIDASAQKLESAIDPYILDSRGNTILGKLSGLDPSLLAKIGKVGYVDTLKEAYSDNRSGKNPMVIKATGSIRNCDLIVSDADGNKILKENEASGLLNKLNIVVII